MVDSSHHRRPHSRIRHHGNPTIPRPRLRFL
uniref:Uncharacterized protein n=1 Tax=Myoviridae sp. ctCpP1 TaxID=2825054 RepID=A0A8S5V7L7_9CAUD|nr:MAG TPA: hypothetical protein [Myoviridae sp. ctCpP1]